MFAPTAAVAAVHVAPLSSETNTASPVARLADKVPVIRWQLLRCVLPYALEGWLRRELGAFGATLTEVQHGDGVDATLRVPQPRAAALVARINDAGQGRVVWRDTSPA